MHPLTNIAIKAARTAGDMMSRSFDQLDRLELVEKTPNNYVTNVDIAVEQQVIEIIHEAYPDHGIIAEESGEAFGDSNTQWIIDPIDGTTNFVRGIPHFAISLGIMVEGKVEHGVIYDPIKQELFTASRGRGAQLNNTRIRTKNDITLDHALIATGFAYERNDTIDQANAGTLKTLLPKISNIRRMGAAALDLAYVAAGRIDGYFEIGVKPWDVAAGSLMVKEAGGFVSDYNGSESFLDSQHIVAASPKVFKPLLQAVKNNADESLL